MHRQRVEWWGQIGVERRVIDLIIQVVEGFNESACFVKKKRLLFENEPLVEP